MESKKGYNSTDPENSLIIFDWKEDPHGWIQWKGTGVCIDIHCKCGKMSHFDGRFMYFIVCPYCKRVYEVNGHVQFVERDPNELNESRSVIQMGNGGLHASTTSSGNTVSINNTTWSYGDLG